MRLEYLILLSSLCQILLTDQAEAQQYSRSSESWPAASAGYSEYPWRTDYARYSIGTDSGRIARVPAPMAPGMSTLTTPAETLQQSGTPYYAPYPALGAAPVGNFKASCASPKGTTCCSWFGVVGGLYMTRDQGNPYRFSYDTTDESIQLLNTREASMDLSSGVEARIGRTFCCGQKRVELVYWGLYPGQEQALLLTADTPANINGILNWDDLDYNGLSADNWVDNALVHRVRRDFEFHDVELNLLKNSCCTAGAQFSWLAGFRYFRFGENLGFAADNTDLIFTGAANEIYYNIDVDNDLFGFQLGAEGLFPLTSRCELALRLASGVHLNHISHHSRIGGAAGDATVNNGPLINSDFNVQSSKTDVALLSELDANLRYCLHGGWQVTLGYRLLGATGVALPTNQIYPDLRGVNDVAEIDSNGSLILYGGYARVELNY